jgi:hypothetical protein
VTPVPNPPSAPPAGDARKTVAAALLIAATIAYALICFPAASRRGYSPIDYAWIGVTYLWIFAIPLFTMIVPPGHFSRHALFWYALATAYIDGCTVIGLVPHRLDLRQGILFIPFFGPIHLAAVAFVAWLSRRVIAPTSRVPVVAIVLILAAATPFAYRYVARAEDASEGRQRADADWAGHTARIISPDGPDSFCQMGNLLFETEWDSATGLRLQHDMRDGYEPGYNARVAELLRLHGLPDWSMKNRMVSDADMAAMLTSADMKPVTTFPRELTPDVVLMRRGTLNRWGGSMTNDSDGLCIETSKWDGYDDGDNDGPAYIGRLDKYPGVVFVRCGSAWVAACTDDGWILSHVSKNEPATQPACP